MLLVGTHHATIGGRNYTTVKRDEATAYECLESKMVTSK